MLSECDLEKDLAGRLLSDVTREIRRRGASDENVLTGERFAALLYVLTREYEVRRTLMGYSPVGPMDALRETMSKLWGLSDVPDSIERLFPYPPNEQFPTQGITAASILESLAIMKESVFAVDTGEAGDADVLNKASIHYTFALAFARDILLELFPWEYQPVELEAALNLALWPPFEPSGLVGMNKPTWHDIEAGHRFCRIIGWLRARGKPLTAHDSLSHEQRDELFRGFFEEACEAFHWPSPFRLANAWREHLQKSAPWTRTENLWWCLGEKRLRTNAAIHMLTEFNRAPYLSWFASSHEAARFRPSFNFVRYEDIIEIHEQHCDSNGGTLSARLESHAFLGMLLVLGYRIYRPQERPEDEEILDQHLRLMPRFLDAGPGREMAERNCQILRANLL